MLDRIPDGWQESSLLGIADYLNGLAMQKYRPKDDEQGLPVLKIKELRQGSCDFNSELCSPSIKPEYIVHDGDVIFPVGKRKFRNSHPSENESKYCPQYLQSLCSGAGIHIEAASTVLHRYTERYPAQKL